MNIKALKSAYLRIKLKIRYRLCSDENKAQIQEISIHKLFDKNYYEKTHNFIRVSAKHLACHYFFYGAKNGLNPSALFLTMRYLEDNADVAEAKMNPLYHYITYGYLEKRKVHPVKNQPKSEKSYAQVIDNSAWDNIKSVTNHNPVINIIIPVYGQLKETMACIYSVLNSANVTPYEIIVIDDCSPDAELSQRLIDLQKKNLIKLLRNKKNLGFVSSVNIGMKLNTNRHVILLNSDTCVFSNWIDRIYNHYLQNERVATITPLSNSATICSYPYFCEDFDYEYEVSDRQIDEFASKNQIPPVLIPTGVGFCMFISSECLTDVGLFDEKSFGKGYGEENDFCRRASYKNWNNYCIGNVFVRHYGGASFGNSKKEKILNAIRTLNRLHPDYDSLINNFVKNDPVRPFRLHLDLCRSEKYLSLKEKNVLIITHNLGGGTETHVQQLSKQYEMDGLGVVIARSNNDKLEITLNDNMFCATDYATICMFDCSELLYLYKLFSIKHVHVHHLINLPCAATSTIDSSCKQFKIEFDVTLHDYFTICPRVNLVNIENKYCMEPDESECNSCAANTAMTLRKLDISQWRYHYYSFLKRARKVFVPDSDVSNRINRYFPELETYVKPHILESAVIDKTSKWNKKIQKIVLIGAIGPHKGSNIFLEMVKYANTHLPYLKFHIIGYTDQDQNFEKLSNVSITGQYDDDSVHNIIKDIDPDAALFLSPWPETFSYTLSIALKLGIYPIVYDIGAPSARLRELSVGTILPYSCCNDAIKTLEIIVSIIIDYQFIIKSELGYKSFENYYQFDPAAITCESN
jgi:GT2 family glycosyltransferase